MFEKFARAGVVAGLSCISAFAARAEIVKVANIDCGRKEICLYWWPKLPPLMGWHTDEDANYAYGGGNGINTLVPDGSGFSSADTVMYAQAVFKVRYEYENPESKTLDAFIANDMATIAQKHSDMRIEETTPLAIGDGRKLRSLTYFRSGQWERVSYGEEGEYYLVFVINAHSENGYRTNLPVYESLVRNYRQ